MPAPAPILPDHGGRCVSSIVPGILSGWAPEWFPAELAEAQQVVLFVVDGLGHRQLMDRSHAVPLLGEMAGPPLTTVAPSTTAAALTSITTGVSPSEHGIVGYRMRMESEVMNAIRWRTERGDARRRWPPSDCQPIPAFMGQRVVVVSSHAFTGSGFTEAHQAGADFAAVHSPTSIPTQVGRALADGERFVYCYHDGLDHVAHATGLGERYLEELRFVELLVARLRSVLPDGAVLVVIADHGQVHIGENVHEVDRDLLDLTDGASGEARFLWLHARRGSEGELLQGCQERLGGVAWVRSADEAIGEGWFGPGRGPDFRRRLGDVALVPHAPIGLIVEPESWSFKMTGRHGSLTADEMLVPFLVGGPMGD